MSLTAFAGRLCVALVLGTLIGVERQWHRRLADLKVTALVCIGATLFTASYGYFGKQGEDPTRIAAQVVVGVGFLGAGLLWRDGGQIRGITTAATLWCSAAVGVFVGVGAHREAAVSTLLIVLGNTLLRPIGHLLNLRMGPADSARQTRRIVLETAVSSPVVEAALSGLERDPGLELLARSDALVAGGGALITIDVAVEGGEAERHLDDRLAQLRGAMTDQSVRQLQVTRQN